MCNLKQLTFSCGHSQLTLLNSPCDHAFRRKWTPYNRPPDFCRSGIHITKTVTSLKVCRDDCRRKEARETLYRRYKEAFDQIEMVSKRVELVSKCMAKETELSEKCKTMFKKLGQNGWDEQKLADLCKLSLEQVRQLLREYSMTKSGILKELDVEYAAAKDNIKHFEIENLNGTKTEIVSFDKGRLEELGDGARDQLYDLVLEIERRASEACLDRVGWELPKDDGAQTKTLRELSGWKRGIASGSRMDDAFVGEHARDFDVVNETEAWSM